MIVEYKKENNSKYGNTIVSNFSIELSIRYGKGFDKRNIFYMTRFYELFSKVNPGSQLKNISWTHIRELLKFNDIKVIEFYLNEIPKEKELLKIINNNQIILLKTEQLKLDK